MDHTLSKFLDYVTTVVTHHNMSNWIKNFNCASDIVSMILSHCHSDYKPLITRFQPFHHLIRRFYYLFLVASKETMCIPPLGIISILMIFYYSFIHMDYICFQFITSSLIPFGLVLFPYFSQSFSIKTHVLSTKKNQSSSPIILHLILVS